MKKFFLIFLIYFLFVSCSSMKEAGQVLRNEKVKTTDEFLVEKKEPLVLPPDYNEIPEPGTLNEKKQSEEENIKKILNVNNESKSRAKSSTSTEESIIEKIYN